MTTLTYNLKAERIQVTRGQAERIYLAGLGIVFRRQDTGADMLWPGHEGQRKGASLAIGHEASPLEVFEHYNAILDRRERRAEPLDLFWVERDTYNRYASL